MDGRAGRAEIDPLAPGLQVVLRVLAVQREAPRGLGERVLDQRAREDQAALVVDDGAGRGQTSMQEGMASARPICSSTSRAAW